MYIFERDYLNSFTNLFVYITINFRCLLFPFFSLLCR
ncbi:hypothetical protein, partial [Plasmodium yoelii yoelii]